MVTEYGMGTELRSRRLPADDYSMSDATRRLIDDEQQHISDLAYRRALALVTENRPLLEELAATLLDQEVIERGDIERIVGERGRADVEPVPEGAEPPDDVAAAVAGLAAAERIDPPPGDLSRPSE